MNEDREQDVIRAFVGLSNDLVAGYDTVDLLTALASDCARLLDVASAGLLLSDGRGVLHVVAASSEQTRNLELFQLQREEGPCLDCFHSGQPVFVPDLAEERERWPQFVPAATSVGFVAVHAMPMRLRDNVLGAMGLFSEHRGVLADDDIALAQALAHVASVAIVNNAVAADSTALNEQLQGALTTRIVLEQAKGVLAHTGQLTMDDAFAVLRRYARDHGLRLGVVAARVVSRDLRGELLIEHARRADLLS